MNFFKSVFSDDTDPPKPESDSDSDSDSYRNKEEQENPDLDSSPKQSSPNPNPSGGGWNFVGLIKTLTTKSESVIETYRRDLQEFGSGLRKEIEVAQGSLENVGYVIDEFGSSVLKGTAQIISHGKDAILAADHESDSSDTNSNKNYGTQRSLNSKRYSRFDSQVRAIQGDLNTYCEEPEDSDDYSKWKLGFVLEERSEEMKRLVEENGVLGSIYEKVVPNSVDHETFWSRYFYRVHKLKHAEDLRANIVKRAISREEEEELSWDVDDEDEEMEDGIKAVSKMKLKENEEIGSKDSAKLVKDEEWQVGNSVVVNEVHNVVLKRDEDSSENKELGDKDSEQIIKEENSFEESQNGSSGVVDEKEERVSDVDDKARKESVVESGSENVHSEVDKEDWESKSDEKTTLEAKAASRESSKGSDFSVISSQPSMHEEEDLGWDEIEDLSSIDEKKVAHSGSPNKADLLKRLSAAEEEEDLSWDIEDDDEPVKA